MGHTITEKILSAHSGTKDVSPGDIVMADLDLVVDLDIVFGITGGHQTPTRVFDPDKIAVVADRRTGAEYRGGQCDAAYAGIRREVQDRKILCRRPARHRTCHPW